MLEPIRPDAKQLRSQLESYKLVVEANQELFDRDVPTRDDLAAKFKAVQVLLDQLEQSGEKADYIIMVDDANLIVSEIRDCIKLMLSQDDP